MIEQDTVKLLRECDAGIKMGVDSIEDVLPRVCSDRLKNELNECKRKHDRLKTECHDLLTDYGDEGKDPNPVAKGMSWMKTEMKMLAEDSDSTIAELMTDGCNMGIKSLCRYLNQYKAADEKSKDITKRLVGIEEQLAHDLREYL